MELNRRVGIFYEELGLGVALVIAPLVADIEHDTIALGGNGGARGTDGLSQNRLG